MKVELDKYYPGNKYADYLFDLEDWIEIQKSLVTGKTLLQMIATKNNLLFIENLRFFWPGVKLRRQKGLKRLELELVLNSKYFEDKMMIFELNERQYWQVLSYRSLIDFRNVATFDKQQISDLKLLFDQFERVLEYW